ncbi:SRPBCC family protein [Mycobacterium sp. NPDC006124]|uniref:SRPBCC family protein n=1 Tax=Mycobacterium sp. NPDC006124 TaxID=3156729 RepID=UPI0033A2BC56
MLTTARTIAAPAESAWRLLTDLSQWSRWGPTVRGAQLDDPGPLRLGSRGKVWTPIGVPLPFEITEFDDGRAWAWRVAGVSATRHVVTDHADGCRVSFGVPSWAPAYLPVCALALKRIEELARA